MQLELFREPAKEPVPQGRQIAFAEEEENVPLGQSKHDVDPIAEYCPESHEVHEVAPDAEYVPAGQGIHTPVEEYVPGGHEEHENVSVFQKDPSVQVEHEDAPKPE